MNAKRILSAVAFLSLAVFSCYWTAESLFIWQPSITRVGAWLIAIVFYVVASICFSSLVKVFDPNVHFGEGLFKSRGGHIAFGLLGLVVFWLLFSLPTNTHTLLYRASIRNALTNDLVRTDGYLQAMTDNNAVIDSINRSHKAKQKFVNDQFSLLDREETDKTNWGQGRKYDKLVQDLEEGLGAPIHQTHKSMGNTANRRYIHQQALDILNRDRERCDKEIAEILGLIDIDLINNLRERLSIAMQDVYNMKGTNNDIIRAAVHDLEDSYSHIKKNSKYISFKNEIERDIYTREGAKPESETMLSVPDVWRDVLTTDKYRGHGFIWWVLLALLVDLAAFIFFDIAAKSGDDFSY